MIRTLAKHLKTFALLALVMSTAACAQAVAPNNSFLSNGVTSSVSTGFGGEPLYNHGF